MSEAPAPVQAARGRLRFEQPFDERLRVERRDVVLALADADEQDGEGELVRDGERRAFILAFSHEGRRDALAVIRD